MSNKTANYNLTKPAIEDFYDIEIFNENADIIDTELKRLNNDKVDKVAGKGLSANDFTTTEKTKLSNIAENANNYIHPTGDGNLHIPATGTTNQGKVLTAGSTEGSLSWQDAVSKNIRNATYAKYTSSGTFVSNNIKDNKIFVACVGGGGGYGGTYQGSPQNAGGGGGAGGYVSTQEITVTPSTTYNIVIGSAGANGTSNATPTNGGNGGSTIFGDNLVVANGGGGGYAGSSTKGGDGGSGGSGGGGGHRYSAGGNGGIGYQFGGGGASDQANGGNGGAYGGGGGAYTAKTAGTGGIYAGQTFADSGAIFFPFVFKPLATKGNGHGNGYVGTSVDYAKGGYGGEGYGGIGGTTGDQWSGSGGGGGYCCNGGNSVNGGSGGGGGGFLSNGEDGVYEKTGGGGGGFTVDGTTYGSGGGTWGNSTNGVCYIFYELEEPIWQNI